MTEARAALALALDTRHAAADRAAWAALAARRALDAARTDPAARGLALDLARVAANEAVVAARAVVTSPLRADPWQRRAAADAADEAAACAAACAALAAAP